MQKIRHFKGQHFTLPMRTNLITKANKKTYTWYGEFPTEAKYDFPDPNDTDEMDWSKFCGVSFSPLLDAMKNAVLVGWRYNDKSDRFELSPYWHRPDGVSYYAEKLGKDVFIVKENIPFEVQYDCPSGKMTFIQGNNIKTYDIFEIDSTSKAREVNTWFGGTDPSPKSFCILKSKLVLG